MYFDKYRIKNKNMDLVSVHTWHQPSNQRRKRPYVGSRREFSQVQIDRSDLHTLISAPRQNLRTVKTIKTFTQNRSDFFLWILHSLVRSETTIIKQDKSTEHSYHQESRVAYAMHATNSHGTAKQGH